MSSSQVVSSSPTETVHLTPDSERSDCERCGRLFNLVRRRHHCRNCGMLVCGDCSKTRWPGEMLKFNPRNEKWARVCRICHGAMEGFRTSLLEGNFRNALRVYEQNKGNLQLFSPYLIYRQKMYPIHCAAAGGSVECLSWLVSLGCDTQSRDALGWTPLTHAADNDHLSLIRWLIIAKQSSVNEISNVDTLRRTLHNAVILLPEVGVPQIRSPRFQSQQTDSMVSGIGMEHLNLESSHAAAIPRVDGTSAAHSAPSAVQAASATDCQLLVANMNMGSAEAALEPSPDDESQSSEQLQEAHENLERSLSVSSVDVLDSEEFVEKKNTLPPQFMKRQNSTEKKGRGNGSFASGMDSLNESDECIVCFANPVDSVLVPCGHFCCCHACASEFFECPICRLPVEQVVKTFKT